MMALTADQRKLSETCERYRVRRLAAFGSRVDGGFTAQSDLDLLVEFEPGARPGLSFIDLEHELSELFAVRVDLNTPGFLSRHFRERVLAGAETIYERT